MLATNSDARNLNDRLFEGKSADFLRRRLAQAEMQLREMEAEAKRVAAQKQRNIDIVRRENQDCLERIEEIRMDECVENLDTSEGMAAAKILASKSEKYCRARDLVAARRAECAEAEAELAGTRQQIVDLRRHMRDLKRRASGMFFAASTELTLQGRSAECSREQLRNLEGRIIKEREQLGAMILTAKNTRTEIDGCLIEQSRYEKNYARRLNELLEKQKEISFITEICQVIFEERDHQAWELREMQGIAEEERQQYENAFSEISAVLAENKRQSQENESKSADLRKSINETRVERVGLEAEVAELHKSIQKQLHNKDNDENGSSGDQQLAFGSASEEDDLTGRIREYKTIFDTLADIADVESIAEVVSFPKDLGEKRFSTFKEINHLDDAIKQLEKERRELIEKLTLLSEKSPVDEHRLKRMKDLRQRHEENRRKIEKEKEHLENTNGAVAAICADIETIFLGLDCNSELLEERTGMTTVIPNTALAAFCIAEQRAQEYLLVYSKKYSASAGANVANFAASKAIEQVTKPLLRRADLLPRKNVSVPKQLRYREFPRTNETMVGPQMVLDGTQDERPLSLEEMRSIALQRARSSTGGGHIRREKIPY